MNHHLFLVTHGLNNWKSDPQTRSCFAPNGTRDSQQTPASQFRAMNRLSKRVENYRIFSFPIWNFHKHRICFLLIILVSSQTSYCWPPTSTPVCIVHFSSPTSRHNLFAQYFLYQMLMHHLFPPSLNVRCTIYLCTFFSLSWCRRFICCCFGLRWWWPSFFVLIVIIIIIVFFGFEPEIELVTKNELIA